MKVKRMVGRKVYEETVPPKTTVRLPGGWHKFTVHHLAAPQGSHRQGFGKSVKETNPRTEPYRQAVADACELYLEDFEDWTPLDGPLEVVCTFYMPPPPASDPSRRYPHTTPDLDKLLRSTFDGITRGGLWKDDARVVAVAGEKVFAASMQETGVDISVRLLA